VYSENVRYSITIIQSLEMILKPNPMTQKTIVYNKTATNQSGCPNIFYIYASSEDEVFKAMPKNIKNWQIVEINDCD
jgi:hypothetical protein